jgi:hypothetical protein
MRAGSLRCNCIERGMRPHPGPLGRVTAFGLRPFAGSQIDLLKAHFRIPSRPIFIRNDKIIFQRRNPVAAARRQTHHVRQRLGGVSGAVGPGDVLTLTPAGRIQKISYWNPDRQPVDECFQPSKFVFTGATGKTVGSRSKMNSYRDWWLRSGQHNPLRHSLRSAA